MMTGEQLGSQLGTDLGTEPTTFGTSRRRITPTPENPKGYPLYKLEEVPSYTNRQLRYYRQSGQIGTS